ncbi:MAG: efflux RND transporter periplasmic adaptor subunit [Pseudomonadota bacterium]
MKRKWLARLLRFVVGAGILMLAVAVAIGLSATRQPPDRKPKELLPPLVDVLTLVPDQVQFTVESQGTVQPLTQTALSAEVAGSITAMSERFIAGGVFEKGDVLLRIDPVNYEVTLERAKAALRQRKVEYDGASRLREQGYRAEAELASAEAALAAANADLVSADRNLERSIVRAPYKGIVRSRSAQLGDYVAPGTPLGVLFATDAVEVRLPLPDTELSFVSLPLVGEEVADGGPSVALEGSFRGRPARWTARIVRTEGIVDERNRMVFAVARVNDPYRLALADEAITPLPVGTFVTASIDGVSVENVVRIPRLLVRNGNQVVFVDDELKLRFRELTFLRTDTEFAYLDAAQLVERRVLTTRLDAPLNGTKVRTAIPEETMSDSSSALEGGAEAGAR